MPQNLELKARLSSIRSGLLLAHSLGAKRIEVLRQTDTYFNISRARLKLRQIAGRRSELIYYRRPRKKGGRYSDYLILPVGDAVRFKSFFAQMLGVRTVVVKRRILFRFQNARIHLDRVQGLGTFLEFEVIVTRGKRQAQALFRRLVDAFRVDKKDVIAGSYSDL